MYDMPLLFAKNLQIGLTQNRRDCVAAPGRTKVLPSSLALCQRDSA